MARYFDASRSLHQMEEELRRVEYGDEYDEEEEYDEDEDLDEEFDEEEDCDDEDWEEDSEEEYDEEYEEEEPDPRYYRRKPGRHNAFRRDGYEDSSEETSVAPRQNRRIGKLLLLALLEILGIYMIIRWWIQWL